MIRIHHISSDLYLVTGLTQDYYLNLEELSEFQNNLCSFGYRPEETVIDNSLRRWPSIGLNTYTVWKRKAF